MKLNKKIVIALDGHSSCGKSSFAKIIASRLNYAYVDSGAMYRAATLYFLKKDLLPPGFQEKDLIPYLGDIQITFRFNKTLNRNETILNGEVVEDEIRTLPVSEKVSDVSRIPEIRDKMVSLQQKMGRHKGIVMDGRDIGTTVFPLAEIKIFLTASAEIRARRRYDELIEKGEKVSLEEILENVKKRDRIDETREVSPLKKADDAVVLDNSHMSFDEEWEWFVNLLSERGLIQ